MQDNHLSLNLLKPVQALAAAAFFKHRRMLLMLPRQEGKTELGIRLIHSVMQDSQTRQALFLAKSQKAAKKASREKFARLFDKAEFKVTTEMVTPLNPRSRSACFIDSVDKEPDRMRGGTYWFIDWTEIAFSEFELGVTVDDVIQKILMPTFRQTNGYFFGESTPNGKNGWYDLWENAADYGFAKMKIGLGQMVDMGLVSRNEYDNLRSTTHPDIFDQEYECKFVSFSGLVYSEMKEKQIQDFRLPPYLSHVVCGIDWGFNDATCLLAAYKQNGVMYIFDEIYVRRTLIDDFANMINEKKLVWDCRKMIAVADHDPARIEELHLRGIECGNADKNNVLGCRLQIKELMFLNKIVIHPRCVWLLKDIQSMEWSSKKTENKREDVAYEKCSWGHYDAEAALRYLVRKLFEAPELEDM